MNECSPVSSTPSLRWIWMMKIKSLGWNIAVTLRLASQSHKKVRLVNSQDSLIHFKNIFRNNWSKAHPKSSLWLFNGRKSLFLIIPIHPKKYKNQRWFKEYVFSHQLRSQWIKTKSTTQTTRTCRKNKADHNWIPKEVDRKAVKNKFIMTFPQLTSNCQTEGVNFV